MKKQSKIELEETKNFVDKKELNLWKEVLPRKLKYGMEGWQLLV